MTARKRKGGLVGAGSTRAMTAAGPRVSEYMRGVIRGLGLDRMAGRRWKRYRDPKYDDGTDLAEYIGDNPGYVHPYVGEDGVERAFVEIHDAGLLGGGASLAKAAYSRDGLLVDLERGGDGRWRPAWLGPRDDGGGLVGAGLVGDGPARVEAAGGLAGAGLAGELAEEAGEMPE